MKINVKAFETSEKPSSDIFVVQGTKGEGRGIDTLIDLMKSNGYQFYKGKGMEGIISRDNVVLLKVNSQWDQRGGTNTDLVKSIVSKIVHHPDGFVGEVVISDNGQDRYGSTSHGGSLDYAKNNALDQSQSNKKVAEEFSKNKVSVYLWDKITSNRVSEYSDGDFDDGYIIEDEPDPVTGIRVSYPKFRTNFGSYVSFKYGVWEPKLEKYDHDKLILINIPVLKAHFIYGVTACVKHYMGVVSDKLQSGGAHRSVRTGGMGTLMVRTRMPDMNILDSIFVNSTCGKGPSCSYDDATELNIISVSKDPVALDYWATSNILMEAAKLGGQTDLGKFDPYSIKEGSHGEWLSRSVKEIKKAGIWVTNDLKHMNVHVANL